MRTVVLLLAVLARFAAADPAPDPNPVRAFAARWPRLEAELTLRHAGDLLFRGAPCAFDDPAAGPPITDTTPASVSPDGAALVVVTTVKLDRAAARQLGIPSRGDNDELGVVALVLDGPGGQISGIWLDEFRMCNPNRVAFTWSADSHRVFFQTSTGHGERTALVEVDGRVLRFGGFTGLAEASPGVRHVAWVPWFGGFPIEPGSFDHVHGDQLHIDDRAVWGSDARDAAKVWSVAWSSDSQLTFCGSTPKQPEARFRAVIAPNRSISVARIRGDCPPP